MCAPMLIRKSFFLAENTNTKMNRTKLRRRAAAHPKNNPTRKTPLAIKSELTAKKKNKSRLAKPRKTSSKLSLQKNIRDVIKKCISGPSPEEKLSDESIVYVGTTYLNFMEGFPRKPSVIDLTKSESNFCSGDDLEFKASLVASACSICTIFPPKPSYLFDSASDEICTCWRGLSRKRNLSFTDVTYEKKPKRRMQRVEIGGGSTELVWKLKKSYPLSNRLCLNSTNSEMVNENAESMS